LAERPAILPGLRWAAWIWLLVVIAWWPFASYWQSDDFIVVHHASDFGRALSDFVGCQAGLEGPVWFYRPLITLSFAIEFVLVGVDPFLSHVDNTVVHGCNAVLVAMLAMRWVVQRTAILAGLAWGLAPHHASCVSWAVGRVDVFATFFSLVALLFVVRRCEGSGSRASTAAAVAAFALALCCKESAVVFPAWIAVGGFSLAGGLFRDRVRQALRIVLPFVVVVVVYVIWRRYALGVWIGGYGNSLPPGAPSLEGLLRWTWWWLAPLDRAWIADPVGLLVLAALPLLAWAAVVVRRRRIGASAVCLLLFIVAFVPTYMFWGNTENPKNLRHMYLGSIALVLMLAVGGPWPLLLYLCTVLVPLVDVRGHFHVRSDRNRRAHTRVLAAARTADPADPLFAAGLDRQNEPGTAVAFHRGTDRMVLPPFLAKGRRLFALRPSSQSPDAYRLPYGNGLSLPLGRTVQADDQPRKLAPPGLPPLVARLEGETVFDAKTLVAMYHGKAHSRIVLQTHSPAYRLTVFTADGYFTTFANSRAEKDTDIIDLRDWMERARCSPGKFDLLSIALQVPIALDLNTRLPLLIESGRREGGRFVASAATREPIWLTFDKSYNELSR
jgi:hypothetical protein